MQARTAVLSDRAVVRVGGDDAEKLLQGIITNDMALLTAQPAIHAALLTPQGKILFEFFVVKVAAGFLLETTADNATELVKRITLYKLRAQVTIEHQPDLSVFAAWGEDLPPLPASEEIAGYIDPRLIRLGQRWIAERAKVQGFLATRPSFTPASADDYHAHRIALGVPEAGKDYVLGEAFPHEADLDQLQGLSLTKGCFVGQEVVSRMEHRGAVRKRVVPVDGSAPLVAHTQIRAGAAAIGTLGSVAGKRGLALLRLDRAAEARAKGEALLADGIALTVRKPEWATFDLESTASATSS